MEENIHITITGKEETRFAAKWVVTQENGETRQYEEVQNVPANYAYRGVAIEGSVTQVSEAGRIEVEIHKDGSRSRSATQGEGSVARFQMR